MSSPLSGRGTQDLKTSITQPGLIGNKKIYRLHEVHYLTKVKYRLEHRIQCRAGELILSSLSEISEVCRCSL